MYAKTIHAKAKALNEIELGPDEQKRLRESIDDDIKKYSNFLIPRVSAKAAARARKTKLDLTSKNWHDRRDFGEGRKEFHFEHVTPVSQLRASCIAAGSKNEVANILRKHLRVAWILKTEDKKLTDLGFRTERPNPVRAYRDAGIKLLPLRARR